MAIADELFTAMERGDATAVQELWNDDIAVWHSGDRADNDHGRALRVIRWFLDNTEWIDTVRSGAYRDWINTNYQGRQA